MPHFKLLPRPTLVVDSFVRTPHCTLELSHWPGNRTPAHLKRDTSTEAVIAWLRADGDSTRSIEQVTVDHFDVDGLLAAWCAIFPAAALEHAQLLTQAASTEDFDRFETVESLELTFDLLAIEQDFACEAAHAGVSGADLWTAHLYASVLPAVERCLAGRFAHELSWRSEFTQVMLSLDSLRTGAGGTEVLRRPDLDLALVTSEHALHPYAINAALPETRLIVCVPGRRTQFLYRYESFVEMVSRNVPGRAPLSPMAEVLNRHEQNGVWIAEGMLAAHPRVLFFGGDANINDSSITPGALIELIAGYFLDHALARRSLWTPSMGLPLEDDKHPEMLVRPPWMAKHGHPRVGGAS
ncbi:DUF6687 family protein [Roseomonas sp. CECT 9278]|uniref:DUF6687 family protein n=1 Tax=Roseomonas sp. CECT 9278 TaxID=2845823 RepID=UPI001E2BD501|nr:DUF6687 family protein [Roseomonas sp. CECT 9278]